MDQPALEARGISKRYGQRDALCGVDLVAEPGRVHGLLGPNGAGKTTLMRIALGLVRPDAGRVRLLGRDLLARIGGVPDGVAGFVEAPAFYPYLSGRGNLGLLARLDAGGGSRSVVSVDQVLAAVGLEEQADVAVLGYSAGMRQRLGIAASLLRSPALLFLDEPTGSLDPAAARHIRTLARQLAADGAAVVLSSHDMDEVEELCAVLTVLDRRRVMFSGEARELRKLAPPSLHVVHTSDDRAALGMAWQRAGVEVLRTGDRGLEIAAEPEALDAYVIALGRAGVAVRALERRGRSLESLFLELTGGSRDQAADIGDTHAERLEATVEAS